MPSSPLKTYYRNSLEFALGVPFTDGNHVKILHNGDEIFSAMLEAINSAQNCIDFVTFVYWRGDIANKFADSLANQAEKGVTVRMLLDAFGAKIIPSELVEKMESAGVKVRWFRPLSTWRIWRTDKRTHRKILICDNKVGFTGGVGIAQQWSGDARNPDEWRDTHIQIQGPALLGLRAAFLDNWNAAGDWLYESPPKVSFADEHDIPIQIIRSSTTTGWTDTASLIRTLISIGKYRIRLVTAYFVPDQVLLSVIKKALDRGVTIEILIPGEYTDSKLSKLAGHSAVEQLLKLGVNVWEYEKTLLHAKITLVDDYVSCIGSANLNHRSMGKDEECCAVILSESINHSLNQSFDNDCQDAHKLEYKSWKNRSRITRLKEKFTCLFMEQL